MKHTVAIIGVGGMGSWHYHNIQNYEKNSIIPNIAIKGFFDLQPEKSIEILAKKDVTEYYCYNSVQEILDDEEIDMVTIATPNDVHRDLAIKCMRAGKNVVCEKPVTLNAKELEDIIAVSEETGKVFCVHQNRRWDKDYNIVKKILKDGKIGKPYFIESRVQGSRGAMHGWRGFKINGGGMLLDWGVHLIDQMMMMIESPVVLVTSHMFNIFEPSEVDDNIKLFLRFENGVSATLEMATNCFIHHPRWHVCCDNGTAVVQNWACEGKILQKKEDSDMAWEDVMVYTEAGPTRTMAPRPETTIVETALPEVKTDITEFYQNVVDVIDKKAELLVKPAENLRVMKVIDALFESQEKGIGVVCRI